MLKDRTSLSYEARAQPALSGFASCAERAGVPSPDAQNFNRFAVWAAGQIRGAPDYAGSLAADRRWGSVFSRCGQPAQALFERLQSAARSAFFRENASQVRELTALVSATVATARQLLAHPGQAAPGRGRPMVSQPGCRSCALPVRGNQ